MYPNAGRELSGTVPHGMGELLAQLKGIEALVKFPLPSGLSAAAHT